MFRSTIWAALYWLAWTATCLLAFVGCVAAVAAVTVNDIRP
jgi:hypothetical protein